MKIIRYILGIVGMTFLVNLHCIAQTVPWTVTATGLTHSILIDATINPSFNGSSLDNGDAIGVFYNSGGNLICGGFGIWTSTGINLIAYGATGTTTNGFLPNEYFTFKLWRKAQNCTSYTDDLLYTTSSVSPIVTASNSFINGGISKLGSFIATVSSFSYTWPITSSATSICVDNPLTMTLPGYNVYNNGRIENPTFSSNPLLSLNSTTGFVDPNSSALGNYTISFFTESCLINKNYNFSINGNSSFSLGNDVSLCPGTSKLLSTSISGSYLWSTGILNSSIMVSLPGTYTLTVTDFNGCKSQDAILIGNYTSSSFSLGSDVSICPGTSKLLSTSISGSYLWSTGNSSASITVSLPGTFTLTVTDFNGCKSESSIIIGNYTTSSFSLGSNFSLCPGSTKLLSTSISGSYLWSNGSLDSLLTVSIPGTYTLTVTDFNGCKSESSIIIGNYTTSSFSLGSDVSLCPGASKILSTSISGSYLWSTGNSSNMINASLPGTYTLSVTDFNGCISQDSILIGNYTTSSFSLGNNVSLCQGSSKLLSTSISGSYLWSDGSLDSLLTVSIPGTYTLTVTDFNGCKSQSSIVIGNYTTSSFSLGSDVSLCPGTSKLLSTSISGSYLWSTGNSSSTINASIPGTYTLTVTDFNGCRNQDTILISIDSTSSFSLGNNVSLCPGTSKLLSASISGNYLWSTGNSNSSITVSLPGTYTLTVTDFNGCKSQSSIVIGNYTTSSFSLGNDVMLCVGTSKLLSTSISGSYLWSTGNSSNSITVSLPGTYTLTVTDFNGCRSLDSINVTIGNLNTLNLGKDTSVCDGSPIKLQSPILAASYLWSTGDTTSYLNITKGGKYFLTILDLSGCKSTDTVNVISNNIDLDQLKFTTVSARCNQLGQININENSISNAKFPFTYSFRNTLSPSTTTSVFNNLDIKDGIYEFSVLDSKGCIATYQTKINVSKTDDCKNPILAPNSDGTLGSVFVPLPGTVKIFDKNGILKKQFLAPNEWDGTDESGNILPMGDYYLVSSESDKTLTITIIK